MVQKKKKHLKKSVRILLMICLFLCTAAGTVLALQQFFHEEKTVSVPTIEPTEEAAPSPSPVSTSATMFLAGDALLHTAIEYDVQTAEGQYDFTLLDRIGEIAKQYDLSYYNQETILGGDDLGIRSYPQFNGPASWGEYMISLGFNLVSLANNHCLDMGTYGLTNSVQYWKEKEAQGIISDGMYLTQEDHDAVKTSEINGIRYAFISYTYGMNGLLPEEAYYVSCYDQNEQELLDKIMRADREADVVIVAIHWGIEYQNTPSEEQITLAQQMADAGADIIIGNHPHTIQPVQWLNNGKTICFYAMGNLVAAQYEESRVEMMGALRIDKVTYPDGSVEVSINDVKTDLLYCYCDSNWRNFDVIPFTQMDETHLSNYQNVYDQYKAIITQMDDSIIIGGIAT